ncbi:MAG: Si-specific NAD(P)(+) transhydrogenase [Methylococcales bacterium]|nr:Si-specific NAD(P)(+) transhydrogenase [Methylococcales bacterium]MBT7443966.1 Si-specific NAD(P)(+) transhydrogenase [Methylococcales bacterium]
MTDTAIHKYDVAIFGSGPGGERAAMQASKLGKRVVLIEKDSHVGGSSLHTGTIPSKSLRETVVNLSRLKRRVNQGMNISVRRDITVDELMYRKDFVIQEQETTIRNHLFANRIDLVQGTPTFKSPTEIYVETPDGEDDITIHAEFTVISTGSRPHRPTAWFPENAENIYDSDSILQVKRLPHKITIIGSGVIGCEYACIFSRMGIRVNLISRDRTIMPFVDRELSENFMYRMRHNRITLRLGEDVKEIVKVDDEHVKVNLASGKSLSSGAVLIAAGRDSNVEGLGLGEIGVEQGKRGLICVNDKYQTSVENIYAVGDVIGFPGLASTAVIQARIAILHAFNQLENEEMPTDLPFGIWTIPSIAMVGANEEELTDKSIPYEVGIAHFKEVARAHIMGGEYGILKLLFDPETLKLLGVHIIGPHAPQLIHLGQSVMYYGGDIKYFVNAVFNYPTLDEAYRIAAFNGMNRLGLL